MLLLFKQTPIFKQLGIWGSVTFDGLLLSIGSLRVTLSFILCALFSSSNLVIGDFFFKAANLSSSFTMNQNTFLWVTPKLCMYILKNNIHLTILQKAQLFFLFSPSKDNYIRSEFPPSLSAYGEY